MIRCVDINADLGESYGKWRLGADDALMKVITSANVACGFHAGDPDVMARSMSLAVQNGVVIGAHPGLPDLQGFGRRRMQITPSEARNLVAYQLGAAQAMACLAGGKVRHLKLHGALANMAAEDEGLARACYESALLVDPDITIVVIAGTAQALAANAAGAVVAQEVFADRAYDEDGSLMPRSKPGAVLNDVETICSRVVAMLHAGAIITVNGTQLSTHIDTICVHGDTPGALAMAMAVRSALLDAGISVTAFQGRVDARATL